MDSWIYKLQGRAQDCRGVVPSAGTDVRQSDTTRDGDVGGNPLIKKGSCYKLLWHKVEDDKR